MISNEQSNGNRVTVTQCKMCGNNSNGRDYCSNACKQKAYRVKNIVEPKPEHQEEPVDQANSKRIPNPKYDEALRMRIVEAYAFFKHRYIPFQDRCPDYLVIEKLIMALYRQNGRFPPLQDVARYYKQFNEDDDLILTLFK